jgi:nucleoside diphosphate kinase
MNLGIIKPDAVKRNLTGVILAQVEVRFQIVALEMVRLNPYQVQELYKEHKDKEFFPRLFETMVNQLVVAFVCLGDDFREFALDTRKTYLQPDGNQANNVIHSSVSEFREIEIFFPVLP